MGNLRSVSAYQQSWWMWDNVNDVFRESERTRFIRVGDSDGDPRNLGFVELDGHFLFFEGKPMGKELSEDGQKRALRALARQPKTTVVFFEGEPPAVPECVCDYVRSWIQHVLCPTGFIDLCPPK